MANNAHHLISRFVSCLAGNNTRVFGIVMAAAILIVAARVLAPFEVGKDQASQLEAAQRLVDGQGLTTTNEVLHVSYDIVDVPTATFLTWWPPGLSLMVAAFLYAGLPLVASLKIIYALITLAGWLGWAILISRFVSQGIMIGAKAYPAHMLALFIPIFFTPTWSGTDLFLWAGIPVILLLVFKAGVTPSPKSSLALVAVAGLLFGALFAIRYASLFLGVAAALLLLQISLPNLKALLKRYVVFGLAAITIMLPVFLYIKAYSHNEAILPAYINLDSALVDIGERAHATFFFLPMISNLIFGIPLIDQITYKVNSTWVIYLSGAIWLAVIIALPLVLLKETLRFGRRLGDDMALGLSILPITLVGSIMMANPYLLSFRRYYQPLALCGVLLACELARGRLVHRWIKGGARMVLLIFVVHMLVYLPALAVSSERSGYVFSLVLGYMPPKSPRYQSTSHDVGYPAHDQIFSKKESSRLKLKQLYEANPHALFFVYQYSFFVYDGFIGGPVPGKALRVFPPVSFWQHAYTSEPVKLFWVVNLDTRLDSIAATNLRVVYADEVEKTKIIESDFQAGYRFGSPLDVGGQPDGLALK